VNEHQTNNSAIFSMQHSSENTALNMENTALVVTFIINFESLKVAKNDLSTRNSLNQLKRRHAHTI